MYVCMYIYIYAYTWFEVQGLGIKTFVGSYLAVPNSVYRLATVKETP